jgi:hypothetical protein
MKLGLGTTRSLGQRRVCCPSEPKLPVRPTSHACCEGGSPQRRVGGTPRPPASADAPPAAAGAAAPQERGGAPAVCAAVLAEVLAAAGAAGAAVEGAPAVMVDPSSYTPSGEVGWQVGFGGTRRAPRLRQARGTDAARGNPARGPLACARLGRRRPGGAEGLCALPCPNRSGLARSWRSSLS